MTHKTIGILGGMGPEATADLYLRIIRSYQKERNAVKDSEFPEIIVLSLPLPDVVETVEDEETARTMLIDGVKRLERSGSDFVAIPCNTVAYFMADMKSAVSIPILDILQETACIVRKSELEKVGLLGTEQTIKSKIYENALGDVDILTLPPEKQKEVTRIILTILSGRKLEEDKARLIDFVGRLKALGAESVILGCTELPLILRGFFGTLDTLEILANAVVRKATE